MEGLNVVLNKLREFVAGKKSQAELVGQQAIETCWTGNYGVIQDFSKEMVQSTAAKMMEEIRKTANSQDPRMANRKRLVEFVYQYAQFQVLVMDPAPAADPTGLRGQPGITGELKGHLVELTEKDKGLREFAHGLPENFTKDDLWNAVLARFRVSYAWAHVFHVLRSAYGDYNAAPGKDWFQPFVVAMCSWQEHSYRQSLGLPSAFPHSALDPDAQAIIMSGFSNCVMTGVRYPDLEWRDRIQKIEIDKDNGLRTLASIGMLFFPDNGASQK